MTAWSGEVESLRMFLNDFRSNGFEESLMRLNEFHVLKCYLERIKHIAQQYGKEAPEESVQTIGSISADALRITGSAPPPCPYVRALLKDLVER